MQTDGRVLDGVDMFVMCCVLAGLSVSAVTSSEVQVDVIATHGGVPSADDVVNMKEAADTAADSRAISASSHLSCSDAATDHDHVAQLSSIDAAAASVNKAETESASAPSDTSSSDAAVASMDVKEVADTAVDTATASASSLITGCTTAGSHAGNVAQSSLDDDVAVDVKPSVINSVAGDATAVAMAAECTDAYSVCLLHQLSNSSQRGSVPASSNAGAVFWKSSWRQQLCRCTSCLVSSVMQGQ